MRGESSYVRAAGCALDEDWLLEPIGAGGFASLAGIDPAVTGIFLTCDLLG
jgi:hypothetical protein